LAERQLYTLDVTGSSPVPPTTLYRQKTRYFLENNDDFAFSPEKCDGPKQVDFECSKAPTNAPTKSKETCKNAPLDARRAKNIFF
jgi:hypothetical protein